MLQDTLIKGVGDCAISSNAAGCKSLIFKFKFN